MNPDSSPPASDEHRPVKKPRSTRKRANVQEDLELAALLVKLARGTGSNNNGYISSTPIGDHVPSPKTLTVKTNYKAVVKQVHPRSTSSSTHTCSKCNKSFPSGQGLGGHISSHNLKKPMTVLDVEGHKYPARPMLFPTGQAIGGHMRIHYGEVKVVRDIHLNVPATEISLLCDDDEPRIPLLLGKETSPN